MHVSAGDVAQQRIKFERSRCELFRCGDVTRDGTKFFHGFQIFGNRRSRHGLRNIRPVVGRRGCHVTRRDAESEHLILLVKKIVTLDRDPRET